MYLHLKDSERMHSGVNWAQKKIARSRNNLSPAINCTMRSAPFHHRRVEIANSSRVSRQTLANGWPSHSAYVFKIGCRAYDSGSSKALAVYVQGYSVWCGQGPPKRVQLLGPCAEEGSHDGASARFAIDCKKEVQPTFFGPEGTRLRGESTFAINCTESGHETADFIQVARSFLP
jgi:hypothetical protein